MSKYYIRLDINNNVVAGFSSDFREHLESDICINENGERQFELLGVINPSLIDNKGRYNYKFVDGKAIELTEEEKENLFPTQVPQPTQDEILSKEVANLKIDNMKSDLAMTETLKTIASLKVEVMNLKGGAV